MGFLCVDIIIIGSCGCRVCMCMSVLKFCVFGMLRFIRIRLVLVCWLVSRYSVFMLFVLYSCMLGIMCCMVL